MMKERRRAILLEKPLDVPLVKLPVQRQHAHLMDEESAIIILQEEGVRAVGGEEVVDAVLDLVLRCELDVDPDRGLGDELLQDIGVLPLVRARYVVAQDELLALGPLVEPLLQIAGVQLGIVRPIDAPHREANQGLPRAVLDAVQHRGAVHFDAWLLQRAGQPPLEPSSRLDRKSTRLNSSHQKISYAVFCLKKKKK